MFCPSCGSDQHGQYCRSCGADLRAVRVAIEKPEASKGSAREEIGRAVADKIRELKSAKELGKVVEDVLPEIEKFLESPAEKRLRRIRRGTITSAIGLAAGLAFTIFGFAENSDEMVFLGCLGFILLLLGVGVMINGWFFTVAGMFADEPLPDSVQKTLRTSAAKTIPSDSSFSNSITEHTTHQLPDIPARARKTNLE